MRVSGAPKPHKPAAAGGAAARDALPSEEEEEEVTSEEGGGGSCQAEPQSNDNTAAGRPYEGHEYVLSEAKDLGKLWALYASDKATGRKQRGEPKWERTKLNFFELLNNVIVITRSGWKRRRTSVRPPGWPRTRGSTCRSQGRLGATGAVNFDHAFFTEALHVRNSR